VAEAAARRAPHRLTGFGQEFAAAFHRFYTDCRIVTDDPAGPQNPQGFWGGVRRPDSLGPEQ